MIGLAEFMNVPGVLNKDPECMEKLAAFHGQHIDGHAPLLSGRALNAYLSCGIRNCHETTNLAEGREKLAKGMQVLIREGSVSKDLAALAPLISEFSSPFLGLCTDDRNPLDIHEEGHLDYLVRRAIALGAPPAAVYRAASWSAARGFGLVDRGLIAPGFLADFLLLDDLESCAIHCVFRLGRRVTADTFAGRVQPAPPGGNTVHLAPVTAESFRTPASGPATPVIEIIPGKILTGRLEASLPYREGLRHADPEHDLLKICVLERHGRNGNIGRGFVKGFGFRSGALASSVGHDSHNLCVVGAGDEDMAIAVNRLLALGGGFVAVQGGRVLAELALPFAGLMSLDSFETVGQNLYALRAAVRAMGCQLAEPFLHLAFLPLPVIPHSEDHRFWAGGCGPLCAGGGVTVLYRLRKSEVSEGYGLQPVRRRLRVGTALAAAGAVPSNRLPVRTIRDSPGLFSPGSGFSNPRERPLLQCIGLNRRAEGIPQRLEPNSLQAVYVRAVARTLQKHEFFRSL